MAHRKYDGIQQLATGTGSGALTLGAATSALYRRLQDAGIGNGDTIYLRVAHETILAEWEDCLWTYNAGGITPTFDSKSSSATGSLISFSAGNKIVSGSILSAAVVTENTDGDVTVTRHLTLGGNLTVANSGPEAKLLNTGNSRGWTMFNWSASNDEWTLAFLTAGAWAGNVLFANRDYTFGVGRNPFGTAYGLDVSCQVSRFGDGSTGYAYLQYGMSATAGNNWHVGSVGDGTFRFYTGTHGAGTEQYRLSAAALLPADDNVKTGGDGSHRFAVIYAGTGTINTSDEDDKEMRGPLTATELQVAKDLSAHFSIWQWKDAIAAKGADHARLHFGISAQAVIACFAARGLSPFAYAVVGFDELTRVKETPVKRTRGKVRMVPAEDRRVEIVDGQPMLVVKQVERPEPVGEMKPVKDRDVNAVLVPVGEEPTGEKDADGKDIMRPVMGPMMAFVQETEEYDDVERSEVPAVDDNGQRLIRLNVRPDQLGNWIAAGFAARLAALEAAAG
jgi:hypothetical protein